jgi:hypothetical protein
MPDMNRLFAATITVSINTLVPGLPYLIMYAKKIMTANNVWLMLKLRADPRNVFVEMSADNTYLFTDSQISRINNKQLLVNMSLWGRSSPGDPITQIRDAARPMPTYSDMLAAGTIGT